MSTKISIRAISGLPEIQPGMNIADLIVAAVAKDPLADHDVIAISQKLVSKAEGQVVAVDPEDPEAHRALVLDEAERLVRRRGDLLITETSHGFVCANSGVDRSNIERGKAVLLPRDPDYSARRVRDGLVGQTGKKVGVLITDTFGRPWRRGVTDVAIGSAGIRPILDLRGSTDDRGNTLHSTEVCVADELAAAAELVKGKSTGHGVVVLSGVDPSWFGEGSIARNVVRRHDEDLFW